MRRTEVLARVLPKPSVSRDDATHVAWSHGWQYHDMFLADGERPFEKVWLTDDRSTSIHWIEDPVLELSYLAVNGERCDEIADALRADLDTFDREDLRAMIERAHEWFDFLLALHHVAAAAPSVFDPELYAWFERGFTHEEPDVRKMAAILTAYPGWPEFRAPLEQLLEDPDEEVREVAGQILQQQS
jgi:hypothetical protein